MMKGMGLVLVVSFIFASFAASASDGLSWPVFRGGPLNDGRSATDTRSAGQYEAAAALELGGLIWATPVLDAQGDVYVGSSNKRFFSFDASGAQRWQATLFDRPDSLIDSAAALTRDGQVVVPGGDGDLHSFDAATGRALWSFHAYGASDASHQSGVQVNSFEGNVQLGPNGWIYAGSDNGTLYCLDAQGHEQWHFATGMMVWSSPAFAASRDWLAFGSLDGRLYLLDPRSGRELARLDVGSDIKSSVATDGTTHLYFGASDGKFRAVRVVPRDGGGLALKIDWEFKTRREIYSSAALADGTLFFGSMDGHLYALEAASGRLRWEYATYSPVASSPTVSADGKLLAGAANGKLYALDARTGQRLWSFQTSPETSQKANLDSSPTLAADGSVWVGSYQGKLHRVGIAHCPLHPEDPRCEFGGIADTPAFGMSQLPDSGAYLRYEDANGRYGDHASRRVGRAQPIHLRLAVYEGGNYVDDAAISTAGIHVRVSRDGQPLNRGELAWSVSSDGKYLNIEPVTFLRGGSHYEVEVSGRYYRQSDWLGDRLQWLTTRAFADQVSFDSEPELSTPALPGAGGGWLLHSLYLTQPKALDTYIPAALDGQDFVVKPVGLTPGDSRLLLAVLPALPTETGFELLAEPARATAIEATLSGDAIRARGSFRLSAMGGAIPFKEVDLSAGLDPQGNLRDAQLRAVASCLGMQGNGSSYHFPWSIVNQLCDPYLRMIGYVVLRSERLPEDGQATPLTAMLVDGGARIRIAGEGLPQGDSLVTAILYDAGSRHILGREFERARATDGTLETSLSGIGAKAVSARGSVLQILVGMRAAEPIRARRLGD